MTPQMLAGKNRGRNSFSLNGDWQITPSDNPQVPHQYISSIVVPSVVDCAIPPYDWKAAKFHWYRKEFALEAADSATVFLKIGQSQFGTDVWVNGTHAGGSIGCYTSHEYDISRFLNSEERSNEIVVRVGRKEDLPPESAVGNDHEKEIYTPGIWGDVSVLVSGSPRISGVQAIPDIGSGLFRVYLHLENRISKGVEGTVWARAYERKSGKDASSSQEASFRIAGNTADRISLELKLDDPKLWSPESPFLYDLKFEIRSGGLLFDEDVVPCGLREFRVEGKKFLLNGKQIFLKGGNIAFHRFLADRERARLPWDRKWIQRVLIDIPKEHNFNFFRNHLGQLYPAWYDIADECGMLIQNEWHFWGTTGSKEQIKQEFTRWLADNWNHPSIVIWDALNECSDEIIQKEIVPEMKRLDPTRPWESVDITEDHPYIYSLGPVLNKERFGFTRGIEDLNNSSEPVMLNEFVWCWIDNKGKPTRLMDGITERWLGPSAGTAELLAQQSFLATELTELFRRIRADAIQPFVYLSNNEGPTAHWFQGPISDLTPKPVLKALKNAFSPVGVSIELWDRHFLASERRTIRIFVLNDKPQHVSAVLEWGISSDGLFVSPGKRNLDIGPSGVTTVDAEFIFPKRPGPCTLAARVEHSGEIATSTKPAHVVNHPGPPAELKMSALAVLESGSENLQFLKSQGLRVESFSKSSAAVADVIVFGEGVVLNDDGGVHRPDIESFLGRGGSVVILEPEYGLEGKFEVQIAGPLKILLEKREDKDKGGYDSYVFPEDIRHQVWGSLTEGHLKMFNGGLGGEMVSQHNMEIKMAHTVLARCGVHLGVVALVEAAVKGGRVLISRIQTRGRLVKNGDAKGIYARRVDPVAQQYFLNLLSYAATKPGD